MAPPVTMRSMPLVHQDGRPLMAGDILAGEVLQLTLAGGAYIAKIIPRPSKGWRTHTRRLKAQRRMGNRNANFQ